jgi:hypothetical protein
MTEGRGSIEIARPVIAVALLDVSGSMTGGSITALVEALGRWVRDAASGLDARASEVLLAVVTFGGAHEVKGLSGSRQVDPGAFVPVGTFDTSSISVDDPNGTTPPSTPRLGIRAQLAQQRGPRCSSRCCGTAAQRPGSHASAP